MAAITVLKGNNVPHGPFSRAEVTDQLNRGEITLESLAFVEGLTQWTPLREVLAKTEVPPPPQVAIAPMASAPIGTGYGATGPVSVGAVQPVGTGYSYAATMQPPEHLVYAGFWLRVVAYLIDFVLLNIVSFIIGGAIGLVVGFVVGLVDRDALPTVLALVKTAVMILVLILIWFYYAFMESSRLQATLGKLALGLRVTDGQGNRVGFGRATGRFFGKIISGLILLVGYMMAGWTPRKQALHDMMADTLVVRKPRA